VASWVSSRGSTVASAALAAAIIFGVAGACDAVTAGRPEA
jgi:hypothetical protein